MFVALIGAVVMLATALTVVGAQDLLEGRNPDEFPQPTITFDESAMRSVPILTEEQKEKAISIAVNDERVKSLIDGRPYRVTEAVIWTGANDQLMGADVTLTFDEPTTVDGEWLEFSWDCGRDPLPPPAMVPYKATFTGVAELYILANVNSETVDQVIPGGRDTLALLGERSFSGPMKELTSCRSD